MDSFDYLSATGSIEGTLPPIYPPGAEIEVSDYSEEFSKIRTGLISATSERSYTIVGTNDVVNFKVQYEYTFPKNTYGYSKTDWWLTQMY